MEELLKIFTFLSREEIEELAEKTREQPFLRAGQKALADHVTTLVHGLEETEAAKSAAAALFGSGELGGLSEATLSSALGEAGAVQVSRDSLPDVVELLVLTGLVKSKGEARRTIAEGGAYLNNVRVEDPDRVPADQDLLAGTWLVLRRGKKKIAGVQAV